MRLCVRPSVRASVRRFSRKPLIRIFWFFAWCCKIIVPKKWRSPIFWEKSYFPVFGHNGGFLAQKWAFWLKNRVFCDFFEIESLNVSDFWHEARKQVVLVNGYIHCCWKNLICPILGHFGPKFGPFWPEITRKQGFSLFSRKWFIKMFWFFAWC